jgi:GNAT superfamily N-acetyltransferase
MIKPVSAVSIIEQAMPLILAHWSEMAIDFDLAPSVDAYAEMERDGVLFALAAFDGDEMVGYSTAMLGSHFFNPAMVVCQSDALFVRQDHRAGVAPGRLILETERTAKSKGAQRMIWQAKPGTPAAAMFADHGYQPVDVAYSRNL